MVRVRNNHLSTLYNEQSPSALQNGQLHPESAENYCAEIALFLSNRDNLAVACLHPFQSLYELEEQLSKLQDSFVATHRRVYCGWLSKPLNEDHLSITAKTPMVSVLWRFHACMHCSCTHKSI